MTGAGTPHYAAHVTGTRRPAAHVISTPVGAFAAARNLIIIYEKRRNSPADYKILFLTLFLLTPEPFYSTALHFLTFGQTSQKPSVSELFLIEIRMSSFS